MDAFSDPSVRELVGVFASQTGKTESIGNMIGQRIDSQPGPMLMIQPTVEMAEAWSKDRLAPMLRDTPCLRGKVRDAKSRDSGNTVRHKQFPGGHLTMGGANSPAGLASRPIRDLFFDEIDRYPVSAGSEGDPIKIASARTRAFWNAKRVYISSPTMSGASAIERKWEESDQRYYHVPCHECGATQRLLWANVEWDKDEQSGENKPETARYRCAHCDATWNDEQRNVAVKNGSYVASKPFRGVAGFHISALYAPWESCRLACLVQDFLDAKGNPESLQTFVNLTLSEWWEERASEHVNATHLSARRETWTEIGGDETLPEGVVGVTVFADVQESPPRVEYEVVGWGVGEESWSLKYDRIYGDVKTDANVLAELDSVFMRRYLLTSGIPIYALACGIDAGYATQSVYEWASPRLRRILPDGRSQYVFATLGRSTFGRPVWTAPEAVTKQRRKRNLWIIGTNAAKEQVYGRMSLVDPGPGYCHFPADRGIGWFEGLTSEVAVTKYSHGRPYRTYEIIRRGLSNEPLDCRVGAYAVLVGITSMGFSLAEEAAKLRAAGAAPERPQRAETPAVHQARPQPNSWIGAGADWLRR